MSQRVETHESKAIKDVVNRFAKLDYIEFNGVRWKVATMKLTEDDPSTWGVILSLGEKEAERVLAVGDEVTKKWSIQDNCLHFFRRNVTTEEVESVRAVEIHKIEDKRSEA